MTYPKNELQVDLSIRVPRPPQIEDVNALGLDGLDHINICSHYTGTNLGARLSNEANLPFVHPVFGKFLTLRGFWLYVKYNDFNDAWRGSVQEIKAVPRTALPNTTIPCFRAIILDAMHERIRQNPDLRAQFLASTLPFTYYRIANRTQYDKRLRIAEPGMRFVTEGLWMIRHLMQRGARPKLVDYESLYPQFFTASTKDV